jgi:hypothetical protein
LPARRTRAGFGHWLAALLRNRVARISTFTIAPLLFMLWWQMGGAPGEVVSQGEASGVVVEVYKHAYLVRLDDGGEVRVFRTRKLEQGAPVRLEVSRYESGVTQYVLPGAESASP